MKKSVLSLAAALLLMAAAQAQDTYSNQLQSAVSQLDRAAKAKEYQQLAAEFNSLAEKKKDDWRAYYYAAFCNAKVGWLFQDDGERIEPFANKAGEQIKKTISLLDTANQKKEMSEAYCILSMVNREKVFVNPTSFGPEFGPIATRYVALAKKENPSNPRAIYLEGWEKYATPKMWGGDKNKARELLKYARVLLSAGDTATLAPHWGMKEVEELLHKIK